MESYSVKYVIKIKAKNNENSINNKHTYALNSDSIILFGSNETLDNKV